MEGTIVNAVAVILGSTIGLLIHSKLPKKIITICFQAIGLFTLFLGITMAAKTNEYLIMIFSIVVGSIIGEVINIDGGINAFSDWLKNKVKSKNAKFSEGFVTSFLLFCMGSMTILGAIEEGLGDRPNLLLAKALLDGFSAVALAASLGVGVLFSAVPVLIYQGGLTLFAGALDGILTAVYIDQITAVGGILLMGLGINILEIKKLKITNMLPSLIVVVLLTYFFL